MLYRYTRKTPLDTGHQYGDILKDGELRDSVIQKFLSTGTLVKVSTPPLAEIPDFEDVSLLLADCGIITVEDLYLADAKQLAKDLHKRTATIRKWQRDAYNQIATVNIKNNN